MFCSVSVFSQSIDAALYAGFDIVYFFKDNTVVKYNVRSSAIVNVATISETFSGVGFTSVDAAFNYGNVKYYLFSKGKYVSIDASRNQADSGYPKDISGNWSGLPSTINAVMNWPLKAYFFKDNQYYRYDRVLNTVDYGYPKTISSSTWSGLTFSRIDAAYSWSNGKTYFFYGDEYISYDIFTDKADSGYPLKIENNWPGLLDALSGNNNNNDNNSDDNNNSLDKDTNDPNDQTNNNDNGNTTNYGDFTVTKSTFDLSPYYASSETHLVVCEYFVYKNPKGGFYLALQQNTDVVILKLDSNLNRYGDAIVINNVDFSDMYPQNDGSIALLVGKCINNTYLTNYSNTIALILIDSKGNITRNFNIFGGNGHQAGKSWFDGRSDGRITCNGSEYGIYFEVQKNFASDGEEDNIHNGDAFFVTDLYGNLKDGRDHFWTASHSSTLQVTCKPNGDFYTYTIGDSYPWGLQFYNRNTSANKVSWPPEQDRLTYEESASCSAPGMLRYIDYNNGYLYAFLSTMEKPNYGDGRKIKPLFLKIDLNGNVVKEKWIDIIDVDASVESVSRFGNNYIVAWADYDIDSYFKIAVVDPEGNIVLSPQKVNEKFSYKSELFAISDKEFFWFSGETNRTTVLELNRIKFD